MIRNILVIAAPIQGLSSEHPSLSDNSKAHWSLTTSNDFARTGEWGDNHYFFKKETRKQEAVVVGAVRLADKQVTFVMYRKGTVPT